MLNDLYEGRRPARAFFRRARYFAWSLIPLVLGVIGGGFVYGLSSEAIQFQRSGLETLGVVVSIKQVERREGTRRRRHSVTKYAHTIAFDEYEKSFDFERPLPVNTVINVTYPAGEPQKARLGWLGNASLWELYLDGSSPWVGLFPFALFLGGFGAAFWNLRVVFSSREKLVAAEVRRLT